MYIARCGERRGVSVDVDLRTSPYRGFLVAKSYISWRSSLYFRLAEKVYIYIIDALTPAPHHAPSYVSHSDHRHGPVLFPTLDLT